MTKNVQDTPRATYVCRCTAECVGSFRNLPQGWEHRTFDEYNAASYDAYLCPDCVVSVNRQIAEIRNAK
jgi:hypothetical protein